ncbi:MAG: ArsR/SmtB family transcription factor [Angustibacter sp.]
MAIELSWLVIACQSADALSKRTAVLDISGDLITRADTFWDDELGLQPELLVLAGQLGCLTGQSVRPLFELDHRPLPPAPPPPLATEPPPVQAAVASRLTRLRRSKSLRRAYSALLSDIWQAASGDWAAVGRSAVDRAVAKQRSSINHGLDPLDLIPTRHVARKEEFLPLTRSAIASGALLLTPTYFAGDHGHVVDLPHGFSVAVGTGLSPSNAARRNQAEQVAGRLKLLSDPTRLLILTELDRTPSTVGDIARAVGVAQPTASVHVRQLRDAGLLATTREGGTVRYRTRTSAIRTLLDDASGTLLASAPDDRTV